MHRLHTWFLHRPAVGDGAWALCLLVLGGWSTAALPGPVSWRHVGCMASVTLLAGLMMLRGRYPNTAVLVAIGLGVGQLLDGFPPDLAGAGYLVLTRWGACYGSSQVSLATLASALAVGPLAVWRGTAEGELGYLSAEQQVLLATLYSLPFLLCWIWGRWARTRRAELAELEARAAAAGTNMIRAATRARIAQELHDVITHDLTAMTVQAGGAQYVLPARPHQARDAVRGLSSLGRQVLAELECLKRLLSS
ncbi:histidine kinase dimerization/phosphoacceptor domain-containing protein [Kitasatospora sp. NPDC093679]|uniref:histidine kinase dimerization/phosphoacceptor domain-containing protein n=1 Tax=Kitasatospora sp. NPDC093679 TaxID=3154983 RepID=UPI0034442006